MSTTPPQRDAIGLGLPGGLSLTWLLGDDPRTITTKIGDKRTVVEFRDPRRLSNSLVVWLDGEADGLGAPLPSSPVSLHVQSVRSGRSRGELIGEVSRESVAAALSLAAEKQS